MPSHTRPWRRPVSPSPARYTSPPNIWRRTQAARASLDASGPIREHARGHLGGGLVTISAVLPNDGKYVQSSGIEHCAVAANGGVGVGGIHISAPELIAAGAPMDFFRESLASYSRPFIVPMTVHREKAPNGIEESENTLSLSATLTATTTVQTGPQGFHPSGTPPTKGGSTSHKPLPLGKRTRREKEQARHDLPEALKEAWAAHGLAFLSGLSAKPLLEIADELGRQAGPIAGNDAVTRVLDDLRIYDDPPLADIRKLATPVTVSAPTFPQCAQTRHSRARLLPRTQRRLRGAADRRRPGGRGGHGARTDRLPGQRGGQGAQRLRPCSAGIACRRTRGGPFASACRQTPRCGPRRGAAAPGRRRLVALAQAVRHGDRLAEAPPGPRRCSLLGAQATRPRCAQAGQDQPVGHLLALRGGRVSPQE